MTEAGTLVAGGGPAGSATALQLARSGAPVTLVEREHGAHHKVCGDFLSQEAHRLLLDAGLDPAALGAVPIDRLRLIWGRASVETALPFAGVSLSRFTLDEALLRRAAELGIEVLRGVRVTGLELGNDGVRARLSGAGGERPTRARAFVLATGKHDLAAHRRASGHLNDLIGFKMRYECDPTQSEALGSAVELTLFDDGYAGMQRIECNAVAFALLIRRAAFGRYGSWPNVLAACAESSPLLASRLNGARALWDRPLAIFGIPYGYVYRSERGSPLYRVGDQFAVIPSFTGDGISIALISGHAAASAIARGIEAHDYHRAMRRQLRRPMFLAALLSRSIMNPRGRAAVHTTLRAFPALLRALATQTRIPLERGV